MRGCSTWGNLRTTWRKSLDYQAGGGVTELLKALDFHNGIDGDDEFDNFSRLHFFVVCKTKPCYAQPHIKRAVPRHISQ